MTYKARIIHSPLSRTYMLEIKTHWWSSWVGVQHDEYRIEGQKSESYYPLYTQKVLYERFKKRAEELLSEEVVYIGCRGEE